MRFLVLPLIGLTILLGFSYWRLSSSWEEHRKLLANELIMQVEAFKKVNNRLPEENEMVFIDESGPVYYQKENDTSYIVHYGTSLGESSTYHSATQQWIEN